MSIWIKSSVEDGFLFLKILKQMTQLARQCLDDFYVENECDSVQQKPNTPQQPTCIKANKNPYKG